MSSRWEKLTIFVLVLMIGGTLAWVSVMRYRSYSARTGDLRNMAQSIWSATRGYPLEFTPPRGDQLHVSRFALHAEIFYLLVVPLYALFPSPITLLIFQSVLFISAAFPLFVLVRREFDSGVAALGFVAVYLMYPVAQTAVLFDFHGDTLAMPLLMWALCFLRWRKSGAYAFFILLSLSCKWYVAFPVVALGIVLLLRGRYSVGLVTLLLGIGWVLLILLVVRPYYSSPIKSADGIGGGIGNYLSFYFLDGLENVVRSLPARLYVGLIVLIPISPLAIKAYLWLLPSLAIILPALLSNGPGPSYHYIYHHYAVAVPFLVFAAVMGAYKSKREKRTFRLPWTRKRWEYWKFGLWLTVLVTTMLSLNLVSPPERYYIQQGRAGKAAYLERIRYSSRDRLKDSWLEMYVSPLAPTVASYPLSIHIPNRQVLLTPTGLDGNVSNVDYGILDALSLYDLSAIRLLLEDPELQLTRTEDGLVLFERDSHEGLLTQIVTQTQTLSPTVDINPVAAFDEGIMLLDFEVHDLGDRRFRLEFRWMGLPSLADRPALFAVSRLEGVELSRFPHLPTEVIYPTPRWKYDEIIWEVFDIQLPADIESGSYELMTGWYDSGRLYEFDTDFHTLVGEEFLITTLFVGADPDAKY